MDQCIQMLDDVFRKLDGVERQLSGLQQDLQQQLDSKISKFQIKIFSQILPFQNLSKMYNLSTAVFQDQGQGVIIQKDLWLWWNL